MSGMEKWWQVGTKLVPQAEIDKSGNAGLTEDFSSSNVWFPYEAPIDSEIRFAVDMPLYLHCEYEDMEAVLSKTYEGECAGHKFQYRLKRNHNFIKNVERNIFLQIANLYNIDKPLIFAPVARRAVDICITAGLSARDIREFAVMKNGRAVIDAESLLKADWKIDLIDGQLITDYRLMAVNVNLSARKQYFTTDGEENGARFLETSSDLMPGTFILPETPKIDDILCIKNKDDGKISRVYLNSDADIRTYRTLICNEIPADELANWYNPIELPRLRTVGDINRYCACLQSADGAYRAEFYKVIDPQDKLSLPATAKIIKRYGADDAYPLTEQAQELYSRSRYRSICYLRFSAPELFVTDYAEYVLSWLERNYPEFQWAGVVNE